MLTLRICLLPCTDKYFVQAEFTSHLDEANVPGWRCTHPAPRGSWRRWSARRARSFWSQSTPGSDRSGSACLKGRTRTSEMPRQEPLGCKHHQQLKRSYIQPVRRYFQICLQPLTLTALSSSELTTLRRSPFPSLWCRHPTADWSSNHKWRVPIINTSESCWWDHIGQKPPRQNSPIPISLWKSYPCLPSETP